MLDYAQLSVLAAVIRTGSFERVAQQLNVTPSAVSQRIKLLEERFGVVLVVRGQPCTATGVGQRLCQHVEQVALLAGSLRRSLPGLQAESRPVTLRIAVNADSLATWFISAMAKTEGYLFDLVLDDQDHSAEWLRQVLGADVHPPLHWLPSSQAFVDPALAGIGWCMNPEPLVIEHLRNGRLIALKPDQPLDVPLFWQQNRIVSPVLGNVTRAVVHEARTMLVQT